MTGDVEGRAKEGYPHSLRSSGAKDAGDSRRVVTTWASLLPTTAKGVPQVLSTHLSKNCFGIFTLSISISIISMNLGTCKSSHILQSIACGEANQILGLGYMRRPINAFRAFILWFSSCHISLKNKVLAIHVEYANLINSTDNNSADAIIVI